MTKESEDAGPFELVSRRVRQHLEASGRDRTRRQLEETLPAEHVRNVDAVLNSTKVSYRDALMIQLAYRLTSEAAIDLTVRQAGARTVAQRLGEFFGHQHIQKVQDAFQNIGKNSTNLARGNFTEFDSFLQWASTNSGSTDAQIEAVFDFVCAAVAATARPVLPMPALDRSALTFARMSKLLRDLFDIASQGAHEQFTIAALLSALIEQMGAREYRVETKNLNASDKSSRTAGDVQILMGNRIVEAYEITASDWETKLPSAEKTVKDHDLTRIHIVASIKDEAVTALLGKLAGQEIDVSVLNLWEFAVSLTSALTRPFRAEALVRLYEYLDRYQPDIERVNRYVQMIESHELTESA